jgi:hypothetical protein
MRISGSRVGFHEAVDLLWINRSLPHPEGSIFPLFEISSLHLLNNDSHFILLDFLVQTPLRYACFVLFLAAEEYQAMS